MDETGSCSSNSRYNQALLGLTLTRPVQPRQLSQAFFIKVIVAFEIGFGPKQSMILF